MANSSELTGQTGDPSMFGWEISECTASPGYHLPKEIKRDRERNAAIRKAYAVTPRPTLAEIGASHGLTAARVHQIIVGRRVGGEKMMTACAASFGGKITPLPCPVGSVREAMLSWRIEDDRGDFVFSVLLRPGWHRGDTDFTLAAYRGKLCPADFPEWFERSEEFWRVRESAVGRLPVEVKA